MGPCVLVIDGTNLLYRSHHALSRSGLTHLGRPIWAVHGLLTSMARLAQMDRFDHLVVAFDSPGGCPERRKLQPSYKATRSSPEQALAYQLEWAPSLLTELGLYSWSLPGWEADDGVASAAHTFTHPGSGSESGSAVVVSSDRDVYQLATSSVRIARPDGTPVNDLVVQDKYGVTLAQYPYVAALRGEPSDNLPGIPGVGAKTAAKLVSAFGSLEGVLTAPTDQLRNAAGPRVAGLVREHAATARLTFEVARLRRDLPVDRPLASLERLDKDHVETLCSRVGLPASGKALASTLSA